MVSFRIPVTATVGPAGIRLLVIITRESDSPVLELLDITGPHRFTRSQFLLVIKEQVMGVETAFRHTGLQRLFLAPVVRSRAVVHTLFPWRSGIQNEHHSHVFVFDDVAVADKRSPEGPELDEALDLVATFEIHKVGVPAIVHGKIRVVPMNPIDFLHLYRFKMQVDRVPPAASTIFEDPALKAIE